MNIKPHEYDNEGLPGLPFSFPCGGSERRQAVVMLMFQGTTDHMLSLCFTILRVRTPLSFRDRRRREGSRSVNIDAEERGELSGRENKMRYRREGKEVGRRKKKE